MNWLKLSIFALPLILAACSSVDNRGTIGQLRNRQIVISNAEIAGGLEKAMESYQRFLEETPGSAMAPEAIRRLADLKVEKEYGLIGDGNRDAGDSPVLVAPEPAPRAEGSFSELKPSSAPEEGESEDEFVRRATLDQSLPELSVPDSRGDPALDALEKSGPLEAISLYQRLLDEYPLYQRNDQVLYQMSRAYEELGRIEEAMLVMDRLVHEFPESRYLDEVQFRRAENFFSHRKFMDAEEAYTSIVNIGVSSTYYQLALYKLGWTFYKQELYEEAEHKFIALLDYKVSVGYDFEQPDDELERKRIDDTFRVISLGFSYLGGADSVVEYFSDYGQRVYEDSVYSNLAEYYFTKRRYNDAVATYSAFATRNPFHIKSPLFHIRIIDINTAGGFPSLVIKAKKSFATNYGLMADYWQYFEPADRPEIIAYLKTNLTDLANHYHALYQSPKQVEEKPLNLVEALHWYREFLTSFPKDIETPVINYQLADLLLENHSFAEAAVEYEKTAYIYEPHEQSSKAGYAAVYAYRQQLGLTPEEDKLPVKQEVVRSSLRFAETFPENEKAAVVLGAAADDLYAMKEHEQALAAARNLIETFSTADENVRRSAWLVIAHSSYELEYYSEAESAYVEVLDLLPGGDKSRPDLFDNLAATIYKQGEQARVGEDYAAAADHFLRIGVMAPTSGIRPTAEYDAAAALIKLENWSRAATVLVGFRDHFPEHELQPEVTKKIAYVYREDGKLSQAADEYERIERESDDDEIRREALLVAAELHEQASASVRALSVYQRYVSYFPQPVGINLETRNKIAEIFEKQGKREAYLNELRQIVAINASAGNERTERTRFLAAKAALVLAELGYEQFIAVNLVKPFDVNLRRKQKLMKATTQEFGALLKYEVGEVTAAATFYLAEIYAHFSKALTESERPEGLTPLELEEYELAIEEQAYPFEERAIEVHESNLELMSLGVYNEWIDKSLERLAGFVPARYAKSEAESAVIVSLDSYGFEIAGQDPVIVPGDQLPALESGQREAVAKDVTPVIGEEKGPAAQVASESREENAPTNTAAE
ncbi:MAG: tetratricopeptide repeat protein [Deltaproteobacteria bacterium]|nr:tetratricopeptide repeat protein [Deltaproteobacteria bacterium]